MCQKLLLSKRSGREIAVEIMLATDAIRNQIREGSTHQIPTSIESSGKLGMILMDRAIIDLCNKGKISREVALRNAMKPEEMRRVLGVAD